MTWHLDPMHTQVEFSAKHFGMMTVRGHFNHVTTSGYVDPAHPADSSVEATINVASLTTNNAQRDNDLRRTSSSSTSIPPSRFAARGSSRRATASSGSRAT